jgi:hypothetical protein
MPWLPAVAGVCVFTLVAFVALVTVFFHLRSVWASVALILVLVAWTGLAFRLVVYAFYANYCEHAPCDPNLNLPTLQILAALVTIDVAAIGASWAIVRAIRRRRAAIPRTPS